MMSVAPAKYATAAQWLHDLGDVPLDRIIFDPWPGTATEADLLRKTDAEDQPCELIEHTLLQKAPSFLAALLTPVVITELMNHVDSGNLGLIAGACGPFRLRQGLIRMPDVSFVSRARLTAAGGVVGDIATFVPELVVEICKPANTTQELNLKRAHFFAAGTRLIWTILPEMRSATVHTSVESSFAVDPRGTLDGQDVLPGFKLPVTKIFQQVERIAI